MQFMLHFEFLINTSFDLLTSAPRRSGREKCVKRNKAVHISDASFYHRQGRSVARRMRLTAKRLARRFSNIIYGLNRKRLEKPWHHDSFFMLPYVQAINHEFNETFYSFWDALLKFPVDGERSLCQECRISFRNREIDVPNRKSRLHKLCFHFLPENSF